MLGCEEAEVSFYCNLVYGFKRIVISRGDVSGTSVVKIMFSNWETRVQFPRYVTQSQVSVYANGMKDGSV